eukprot:scaffold1202_cov110-Isochrysis_galbana.AAC.4
MFVLRGLRGAGERARSNTLDHLQRGHGAGLVNGKLGGRMYAKDFGVVFEGQLVYVLQVELGLRYVGDGVAFEEFEARLEDVRSEPALAVGADETLVVRIGDAAAILHLAHHVADHVPVYRRLVHLSLHQMVLDKLDRGGEVRMVEIVRKREAEGAEPAAFLHCRMQEHERKEQRLVRGMRNSAQHLLGDHGIGSFELCFDSRRRLVGYLDGNMQNAYGKLIVWLGSKPQLKVGRHLAEASHACPQLVHKLNPQMAVVKHHPLAVRHPLLEQPARHRLLPTAERDGENLALQALGQVKNEGCRISALRQDRENGRGCRGLVGDGTHIQRPRLHEALPQRLHDVFAHA